MTLKDNGGEKIKTMKKPTLKKFKSKEWALFCLETIGKRAGTYFIIEIGQLSTVRRAKIERLKFHPDWDFKIKQVTVEVI